MQKTKLLPHQSQNFHILWSTMFSFSLHHYLYIKQYFPFHQPSFIRCNAAYVYLCSVGIPGVLPVIRNQQRLHHWIRFSHSFSRLFSKFLLFVGYSKILRLVRHNGAIMALKILLSSTPGHLPRGQIEVFWVRSFVCFESIPDTVLI